MNSPQDGSNSPPKPKHPPQNALNGTPAQVEKFRRETKRVQKALEEELSAHFKAKVRMTGAINSV